MLACSAASAGAGGCCSASGGGVGSGGAGTGGVAAGGLGCAGCGFGLGGGGRAHAGGVLFADRLTVVVSDHHDDEFGLLGRNDLARHLRPLEIAALIVAD